MRGDTEVESNESLVEGRRTFRFENLHGAIHGALVRQDTVWSSLLLLQAGLNEIKGQRHERGEEPREEAAWELGGKEALAVVLLEVFLTVKGTASHVA